MARTNDTIVRVVYGVTSLGLRTWGQAKHIAQHNGAKISVNTSRTPNVVQLTGGTIRMIESG